jgi:hypothetical protein
VPNLTSMRPVEARGRLARQLTRRRRAAVESRATWDVLRRIRHAADGTQQNDCRDLVLAYLHEPTIARGRPMAKRFEQFTTKRLGHRFLIAGKEQGESKRRRQSKQLRHGRMNFVTAGSTQSELPPVFLDSDLSNRRPSW